MEERYLPRYKELKEKKVVSLTLSGEDYEALIELANAEGIALTEKLRRMVSPFLQEYKKAKALGIPVPPAKVIVEKKPKIPVIVRRG